MENQKLDCVGYYSSVFYLYYLSKDSILSNPAIYMTVIVRNLESFTLDCT